MKLAEKLITLFEEKIDFADVSMGLSKDLKALDKQAAEYFINQWGTDQIWGITGSMSGGIGGADKEHIKMYKAMVAKFGKDKEDELRMILRKWSYSYDELKDGTQPW